MVSMSRPLRVCTNQVFLQYRIAKATDHMSKRSVKQRIRELVEAEDTSKPLSDQEIFRKLNTEV